MAQDKLRQLFWNRDEFLSEIVPKLKQLIRIDEKGNPHFLVRYSKLTDRQKIALHLTARYVAHEAKKVDSPDLATSELGLRTGIKPSVVRARMKEEFDAGLVEKDKKKGTRYSIMPHGISMVVEDVLDLKLNSERKAKS